MRKYMVIFKANFMSNLQYISNMLLNSLGFIIHIFIFFQVWNYIYDDPTQLINGYNKSQMVWYIIITEIIICSITGRRLVVEISKEIRSGNIAYNINKPYSYVGYVIFNTLGETIIRGFAYIIIGLLMGVVLIGNIPQLNIAELLIIVLSMFFAVLIHLLMLLFIGLLSFIMEDSSPLYWLYSKMQIILGIVFPVEFFPGVLQSIIKVSPVYAICYGPAKLFINFEIYTAVSVIIAQIIYIFIGLFLCELIYKKGVRKLNVNGG